MSSTIFILSIVSLLATCSAELSALEKFLTSGFKDTKTADVEEDKDTSGTTKNDFLKFMKRAGVMGGDNLNTEQQRFLNALETLNPNQAIYYQPQTSQQSPLANYVAPKRQLATSQQGQEVLQDQQLQQQQELQQQLALQALQQLTPQQKQFIKQQLLLRLQQLQAQRQQVQQQLQSQKSNLQYSDTNGEIKSSAVPQVQDIESKSSSKVDRQGLYDGTGYEQGYAGNYLPLNHEVANHQDELSHGRYPEPVKEVVYVPKPSVNIKIDPGNILRILLGLIPRPLLNLNGKVFFGVELGKKAGLTTGYAAPVYGGGGKGVVLNLG